MARCRNAGNTAPRRRLWLAAAALLLACAAQPAKAQQEFDPRSDFVYDGDYFIPYSPYVTLNYGYGANIHAGAGEQNLSIDLHFRRKKEYLHYNVGYFSSTDHFIYPSGKFQIYRSTQRSHHFHAGAGIRYAVLKHNWGAYAGVSLITGREQLSAESFITRLGPGFYIQGHYHWKPVYDLGLGGSLYIAVGEHFAVVGIQASIMFSADFKPPAQQRFEPF